MLFLLSARQFKSVLFIEKMDIEISWTDVEHHWTRFELVESRYSSMLVLAVLITRWGFDLGHLKKSYSKTKLWVWKSPGQTGEKKPFPKRPQIISTKKMMKDVCFIMIYCVWYVAVCDVGLKAIIGIYIDEWWIRFDSKSSAENPIK